MCHCSMKFHASQNSLENLFRETATHSAADGLKLMSLFDLKCALLQKKGLDLSSHELLKLVVLSMEESATDTKTRQGEDHHHRCTTLDLPHFLRLMKIVEENYSDAIDSDDSKHTFSEFDSRHKGWIDREDFHRVRYYMYYFFQIQIDVSCA